MPDMVILASGVALTVSFEGISDDGGGKGSKTTCPVARNPFVVDNMRSVRSSPATVSTCDVISCSPLSLFVVPAISAYSPGGTLLSWKLPSLRTLAVFIPGIAPADAICAVDMSITTSAGVPVAAIAVPLILTSRGAKIRGTVVDDRAHAVKDCSIVVFAEDAALGPPTTTRYLRSLRANESGSFAVDKMPAGNYMVAALPVLDEGDEADPELLEQLRSVAVRVSLRWGDTKEVPLKLAILERR